MSAAVIIVEVLPAGYGDCLPAAKLPRARAENERRAGRFTWNNTREL